jgi:hypothetical protein
LIAAGGLLPAAGAAAERVLVDFRQDFDIRSVEARDAKASATENGAWLLLATGRQADWPGITLKASGGHWDLADCGHIALEVKNVGATRVRVSCRVDNPGADGKQNCVTGTIEVGPGEQQTLRVPLQRKMPAELRGKLFGMRGYPGGWSESQGIDPGNVTQLLVFVTKPAEEHRFAIGTIRAGGEPPAAPTDPAKLFPLIDAFGQYMHQQWPGKIASEEDFARHKQAEAADLAAHPGPQDWDQYGGWQGGPQRKATGFFRAEQYRGRWWLVDPAGRLFWSHGIDCVRAANAVTPLTDRRHWFADLPAEDSPFGQFYGKAGWAPHGYYQGKSYETFNFTGANLLRKYGPQWKTQHAELAHRRLRSWGMNTIANWSDAEIYETHRTPYTATVSSRGRPLQGSEGYWGKFDDVFDPQFEASLRKAMAGQKDTSAVDPWCIGYFIGNELSWGNETSLAAATLRSPPDQPAKQVFVEDLKKKYGTIAGLNLAWGTDHASWDALSQRTTPPEVKKAHDDLSAFYTKTAEQYFRVCRNAVKEVAPHHLYLGCRFAWTNDLAVRAAAKYCDVVSFNRYRRELSDLRLPEGVDKPVVIGEFHFGALDRGMFHTGLVPTANQQERAAAYAAYVRSALRNPVVVGTHWFQFGDQATTGRGDGENYQIGLLDVCDTPYAETIQASRAVGADMYRRRAENAK